MRLSTLALSLVLIAGCVSKGDHEAVLKDLQKTKAALQDTSARLRAEESAREKTERELNKLIAERDRIAKDLAAMTSERTKLSMSVEEMKKAMNELSSRKDEADARIAEFRNLVERFKKLIDAGKLRVKIVEGRMVVELATDILFPSGSALLSKDGKAALVEVGALLKDIPGRRFQVEGHTDDVPIKTPLYASNWELAAARAVNVVKATMEGGMPAERISAASYAQFKPAQANDSKEGKAANRRIEIVLVPDLSSLPGFEELQKASTST